MDDLTERLRKAASTLKAAHEPVQAEWVAEAADRIAELEADRARVSEAIARWPFWDLDDWVAIIINDDGDLQPVTEVLDGDWVVA